MKQILTNEEIDLVLGFTTSTGYRSDARAIESAVIEKMVNRFLGWKLPNNFAPDCGINFTPLNYPNGWPTGTNLLTADQAREMFEHALSDAAITKVPK